MTDALKGIVLRSSCPVCAASLPQQLGEFVTCQHCDTVVRRKLAVFDPSRAWDDGYYGVKRIADHHALRRTAFDQIEQKLVKLVGFRGSLLDVGCGMGIFLSIASARGWSVAGLDPSPRATAAAQALRLTNISTGSFLEMDLDGLFDVVTIFDVLRTVPEPGPFLGRAISLVRPGGLLMVRESDSRFRRRSTAQASPQSQAHEYAQLWSAPAMKMMLESRGLSRCSASPSPVFLDGGERRGRKTIKKLAAVSALVLHRATGLVASPTFLSWGYKPL